MWHESDARSFFFFQIIGTFGQEKRWQLGVPSTYQHPLAPSDTLLDPSNTTQLEKRSSSLKLLDTPAATTTAAMVTTEGDGQSNVSERHKEVSPAELSVESVVSIHELSPEPKERKRGGEASVEGGEKSISGVINLADLETNSGVLKTLCVSDVHNGTLYYLYTCSTSLHNNNNDF